MFLQTNDPLEWVDVLLRIYTSPKRQLPGTVSPQDQPLTGDSSGTFSDSLGMILCPKCRKLGPARFPQNINLDEPEIVWLMNQQTLGKDGKTNSSKKCDYRRKF